eukprot:ANDGO_00565.mRNA.1 hypothetical protein CAOG_05957
MSDSFLNYSAPAASLELLRDKIVKQDSPRESLSTLASYLIWGNLGAEKPEAAPGSQMGQAIAQANVFNMQAVVQQQMAQMQTQMNKQMGPEAHKNTPGGRLETAVEHVTNQLCDFLNTNDSQIRKQDTADILAAYIYCMELSISGLPQTLFSRSIAPSMVRSFQQITNCATSGHEGVLFWLGKASEHLVRFIQESAVCRDPAEWGKRKPRLGALDPQLEQKDAFSGVQTQAQPDRSPMFLALQEVIGWFDLPELQYARARFDQFYTSDLVVLCEQTKRAHKSAIEDDADKQMNQSVQNTNAATMNIMNQAFGAAATGRSAQIDTSALKNQAAGISSSARNLVNSKMAFLAIQPYYKLYDGPLLVPALPAILSLVEYLDHQSQVANAKKQLAGAQSTAYVGGQALPSGGGMLDQGQFLYSVAATVLPRAFRALARTRNVPDYLPFIIRSATTISYRSNFYQYMADELLKTGQVFSPYIGALAFCLFSLFKPVTAPFRGSLNHPNSNERVLARFGIDNTQIALMTPAHTLAYTSLLRILASIAVLQPLALIHYRSFWAAMIFSSQLNNTNALEHVCIIASTIARTSPVHATYFIRVACAALKKECPMTQTDMRCRGFLMTLLKSISSVYPNLFNESLDELTVGELAIPQFSELANVDVSIGGDIQFQTTSPGKFVPLAFIETLVNDSIDGVSSGARYVADVVSGKQVHSLPTELAIRDARIEERLTAMNAKIDRNAAMTQAELAEVKGAVEELAQQQDATKIDVSALKSEYKAMETIVSQVQLDISAIREESALGEVSNVQMEEKIKEMVENIRNNVQVQIADLKNAYGEFVKRIPVPRKVMIREGGIFRQTVELHFCCEGHDKISKTMDAAASGACLCPSERSSFIVESKQWKKWLKVCIAAVCAVSSAAVGNVGAALSSLSNVYSRLKEPGDEDFSDFASKLQADSHNQDLLTAEEQSQMANLLRDSGFYMQFLWEPQTMQWCCRRCHEKAKGAYDKWRKLEEERVAKEKALVTKKELQTEKSGIYTQKLAVEKERETIATALAKCKGMFEKQGHKVKNWKKRFISLDAETFFYAPAEGQAAIKSVRCADIKRYAKFDDYAKSIGLNAKDKVAEHCFYIVTQDDWSLLVFAGSEQATEDWLAGLSCLDKLKILDEQIGGFAKSMADLDTKIAALKV